jgi:CBS domain-containing protein
MTSLAVAELMTPSPIHVRPGASVDQALSQMGEADVRHLPVVDAAGRLVGIVSDRDLLRVISKPGGGQLKMQDVMTRDVLTVRPTTLAREASGLLLDHKIGGLPVIDDDGRLVGMVTETDFLRVAHQALGGI